MKTIFFLFLMCSSVYGAGNLSDIFTFNPPVQTPTPAPTPAPVTTTIPVEPPVAVPNKDGVVLLIKSILLRPEGVCLVVVYPTTPTP